jgi:glycine cleavage system H protein
MNIPSELRYTRDHEWLRVEGDEGIVGITDYAQGELGDIVFLDLPEVGKQVVQGKTFGAIEAVKAASDMFAPVSGAIVAVNGNLEHQPELINQSPYGDGWIVRIKISNKKEVESLLNSADYGKLVESEKGASH